MIPLSLDEIAAAVGGTVAGDGAVRVTAPAVLDGRQAEPGGLFVAFAGENVDGHEYAGQAGQASSRHPASHASTRSPPRSPSFPTRRSRAPAHSAEGPPAFNP